MAHNITISPNVRLSICGNITFKIIRKKSKYMKEHLVTKSPKNYSITENTECRQIHTENIHSPFEAALYYTQELYRYTFRVLKHKPW